jgi:hypothetical protein
VITARLLKKALEIEQSLMEFKDYSEEMIDKVMALSVKEEDVITGKSFEFTNFDQSVKIVKEFTKITQVDPEIREQAVSLFDEYLTSRIVPEDVSKLIKEILKNPTLQILRIMQGLTDVIKDPLFKQAVDTFNLGVNQAEGKSYARVYLELENKYKMVNLSLSKL